MQLIADNCELIVKSAFGPLLQLDFPMVYFTAQLNDGILLEASFDVIDEELGTRERKSIRIRVEEITE